jgi:hypothetical protein
MPATVYGLPTHVLVIHAVVVLVPLVASGVIGIALVPRLRPLLRWPLLALLLPAVITVPIATQTGEDFQRKLLGTGELGGLAAEKAQEHAELGGVVLWPVLAMAVFAVALVVLDLRRAGRGVVTLVAALAVVASVASIVQVVLTGHSGATAVWNPGA